VGVGDLGQAKFGHATFPFGMTLDRTGVGMMTVSRCQ
jgi:hypothetical protein